MQLSLSLSLRSTINMLKIMAHLGSSVESSRSTRRQLAALTTTMREGNLLLSLRFSSRHISTQFTYVNGPAMSIRDCSMQRYEFIQVPQVQPFFSLFQYFLHNFSYNTFYRHATDPNHKAKLISTADTFVESCAPNPCQNGGKCIMSDKKRICQCKSHFTGRFCSLTMCELEPCVFGQCELTSNNFKVRVSN